MTKAENRAAGRAFAAEQELKRRQAAHADAVKADLQQLAVLRRYLISGPRSGVPAQPLIAALDDYAGKLTGDWTALHAKSSSIG